MKMLAVKYILPHLFVRVKNNVWSLVHQFHWIIPGEKKMKQIKHRRNRPWQVFPPKNRDSTMEPTDLLQNGFGAMNIKLQYTANPKDGILSQRKAFKGVPFKVYFLKCSWYSHKIFKLFRKLLSEFLSNMERI